LIEGNRSENKIYNPDDMAKYRLLDANIIDTTELSIAETANKILDIIK